jgi:ABC-type nitrate/sulfonate/bicarbonate transport system substrate-binding protein
MSACSLLKSPLTRIALTVSIAFVLGACEDDSSKKTAGEKVKFLLDWQADSNNAGVWIAKELGYYAKERLDVDIVQGTGANEAAKAIGVGREHFIGLNSGAATAKAVADGVPIRSLAVYFHETPTVVFALAKSGISGPKDLVGKKVGLTTGSITVDEFRGLKSANQIPESAVQEVRVSYGPAPLLSGQVDALLDYAELTPVKLRLDGEAIVQFSLADHGVKMYSLNLVANIKAIEAKPELVARITRATTAGYQFVRDNPEEAARIFSKLFPEREQKFLVASMKVVAKQLSTQPTGSQSTQGWQSTIATMDALHLLKRKIGVAEVFPPGQ